MAQQGTPAGGLEPKDVILFLLGVAAPIVVAGLFVDNFYAALGLMVVAFAVLTYAYIRSFLKRGIIIGGTIIAAIIMIVLHSRNPLGRPNFEINFIGLPAGGQSTYYVTDWLIRTQGDLTPYGGDLVLSPMSVEVVPHYQGAEKYGNLTLRVSGASESKEYALWNDFDKSAQTKTIEIPLGDVLSVSGIKENGTEPDTDLMLADQRYQQATLSFQVVRASQPGTPFGEPRNLHIASTPWKQETSVVWRDGWYLDYTLTNFGDAATFHCRMNVGIASGEVTETGDAFWSGTQLLSREPKCEPFRLKKGETYTMTLGLNKSTLGKELLHGRYLVQVYTFAERADLILKSGLTYDNAGAMWLFSNAGDVETFVICNDPGKTCDQTATFPVEQNTIRAFPFTSGAELNNGWSYLAVRSYLVGNRSANQYLLDYTADPQKPGWVGFSVWFENLVDVSSFNGVRFKLILDKSAHPLWVDVKGKIGEEYKIARVGIGTGTYGTASTDEQTVVVPFSAFEGIDWTRVDALNFVIESFQIPDANAHGIRISEIEFIRQ